MNSFYLTPKSKLILPENKEVLLSSGRFICGDKIINYNSYIGKFSEYFGQDNLSFFSNKSKIDLRVSLDGILNYIFFEKKSSEMIGIDIPFLWAYKLENIPELEKKGEVTLNNIVIGNYY